MPLSRDDCSLWWEDAMPENRRAASAAGRFYAVHPLVGAVSSLAAGRSSLCMASFSLWIPPDLRVVVVTDTDLVIVSPGLRPLELLMLPPTTRYSSGVPGTWPVGTLASGWHCLQREAPDNRLIENAAVLPCSGALGDVALNRALETHSYGGERNCG